jgi:hypothetical protein
LGLFVYFIASNGIAKLSILKAPNATPSLYLEAFIDNKDLPLNQLGM